jgi:lactate permease
MSLPPLNLLTISLAALPILTVLYLMIGRRWDGSRAGLAGWVVAVLVSTLYFGAGGHLLLVAWGKAIFLSIFVLYIIWMALLLYHVVNDAGVITAIGRELPGIAGDKPAQALLVAWVFASFLQGATGFGVPAAVVAPLLLGLGFASTTAVVAALIGHAWAVTFGSLGSSFVSLVVTTGLPGERLAGPSAALLAVCCLFCGLIVLWMAGGPAALRQRLLFLLVIAAVMGVAQWVLATSGLWTVASLGAGLAGLVVAIPLLARGGQGVRARPLLTAFFPYLILIGIIVLGQLLLPDLLDRVEIAPDFPAVVTRLGWETAAEPGRAISVFGHAGALLLYASVFIFIWYKQGGVLPTAPAGEYSGRRIAGKTMRGSIKPTIGVYSLVAMALTMQHAGMTQVLALVLSANTGALFPFLSPFIGALGAFMTGSNTNSNVVFGQLQQQTALALGRSVAIILAAQTAGGAIGSAFAPAKVIVGSSTVPGASEGNVLRYASLSGLIVLIFLGILALIFS